MTQVVMLYDGKCIICRQSRNWVRRLDWAKRIELLDAQDDTLVQARFSQFQKEDLLGAIHVVTPDGQILIGFFGVRYLMRFLPLLWIILPWLYWPGMNWLGPKAYKWVARHRYAINRLVGAPICEDDYCKIA